MTAVLAGLALVVLVGLTAGVVCLRRSVRPAPPRSALASLAASDRPLPEHLIADLESAHTPEDIR